MASVSVLAAAVRRKIALRPVLIGLGIVAICAVVWALLAQRASLERRLLAGTPAEVVNDPALVSFATGQAKPLFAKNCAACHGANMKGQQAIGAPDLTDGVWLYGDGGLYAIERTILYGIRSGHPKSHDVTEMPAYGQRGQLADADINNLVQFVLMLSHRPYDAQAAAIGARLAVKANCYDCHGSDEKGDDYYGSTDLTVNKFAFGGDAKSLYDFIYYGRHGVMPAWAGKLSLEQIRALAVYIYATSHR